MMCYYLCWPLAEENIVGYSDLRNDDEQMKSKMTIKRDGKSNRALITTAST